MTELSRGNPAAAEVSMCVRNCDSRDIGSLPVTIENAPEHPVASSGAVVGGGEVGRHFDDLLGMVIFYRIVGWY